MSYEAKNQLVRNRQLKVQELAIPLYITGNAAPASKTLANDEPALLFIKTEGLNQITVANGAMDSSSELSAITFATSNDANGVFSLCLKINEQVSKVCSAQLVRRDGNETICCTFPTGASSGISSGGDKIVLNADSAVDLSAADYNGCLIVRYVAAE
jgi:hypothetical protein